MTSKKTTSFMIAFRGSFNTESVRATCEKIVLALGSSGVGSYGLNNGAGYPNEVLIGSCCRAFEENSSLIKQAFDNDDDFIVDISESPAVFSPATSDEIYDCVFITHKL